MSAPTVNDEMIAAAADSIDKASTTTENTNDSANPEDPKTMKGMLAAMERHSDGTNVLKESIKTFSNPFGIDKKSDVMVASKDDAIGLLKEMIDNDRKKRKESSKKFKRWDFRASPHEHFEKTIDDTLSAFVQWALKEDEENQDEKVYNVSKAFRRVENYADWMEDTGDDLTAEPLTSESVQTALKAWAMKSTIDKHNNFVWWIDFQKIDKHAVKKELSPTESFRAFVWYAHFVMFNENAQNNGFVFVEAVGKLGFIEAMTFVPMKLSVKLDRLTIGILPIKMNCCYVLEMPGWMDMMATIMGLFMSKKMKQRIKVLKEWSEVEEAVGPDAIPKSFGKLEGSVEVDLVDAKYFS